MGCSAYWKCLSLETSIFTLCSTIINKNENNKLSEEWSVSQAKICYCWSAIVYAMDIVRTTWRTVSHRIVPARH